MIDRRIRIDISSKSILKVGLAILSVWIWFRIWQFAMALLVSIFVAVALEPVVSWLEKRKIPRGIAAFLPVLLITLTVTAFIWLAGSTVSEQTKIVVPKLSELEKRARQAFPYVDRLLSGESNGVSALETYGAHLAASTLRAITLIVLGLILTVYLLVEREKTRDWLLAFVPSGARTKARRTLTESREVVFGYVAGNVATSIFATVFVLVSLTFLKVPAALLLALLAGICDFVPALGFIISGLPAVLLALAVSPPRAMVVAVLYAFYHLLENYWIAPKVYGNRLRLSNVAVLTAFAVGAELGGVIGALLALPIAAAYPVIEKIWLADYLGRDVVSQHVRLEESEGGRPGE